MRAFLTGGAGFVGTWLREHLADQGDEVVLLEDGIDIGERDAIAGALAEAAPDVVYHLAALTHVGDSWSRPEETVRVNVLGTVELLEAARLLEQPPRVIIVSSAEVYGVGGGAPLSETSPARPVTPYAASKAAAELFGLQAHLGRGLDVVVVRPFNHVGPGQSENFVVSALARRVVEAERLGESEIRTGNLSAARDFTDVRDVVRCYRLVAEYGIAGEAYNVCSGTAVTIADVLDELIGLAHTTIRPIEDPDLVRPVDVPLLLGDAGKVAKLTGWAPTIPLRETLADVLDYWRAHSHA